MRAILSLCLLALAASPLAGIQHETRPRGKVLKVGAVRFSNSGGAAAQEPFLLGIALLHSYQYVDARAAFQNAERADPAFALAYWCEAFTFSQFDWGTEDLPAAQAALARLAPTPEERLAKAGTPGERSLGEAIETFLAGGDLLERASAFAAAMRARADAAPSDVEAMAFAARGALFLLRYAPPADRVRRAEEAIALAERIVAADPVHPGGVHYLIHATDSPRFAAKGLAAARLYDTLAPDADHALHMPSHIFLQLGMWSDVSASNERAWAASRAWVDRGRHPASELGWHSLQWLQYGYLQQGRYREARGVIDTARAILDPAPPEALAGYPDARYAVETLAYQYGAETGRWLRLDASTSDARTFAARAASAPSLREQQMASAAAYHAVAGRIGLGDLAAAAEGTRAIRSAVDGLPASDPRRSQLRALAVQLDVLGASANDHRDAAIAELTRLLGAARDAGVAPVGPPTTQPPAEVLGAALLAADRAQDAAAMYDRALAERPNRSAALLGLARAKKAAGDAGGASAAYARLLDNWKRADRDVPALAEARAGAKRQQR